MNKDPQTIVEITNTYIKVLQIKSHKGKPILANLDIIESKNRTDQQLIELLSKIDIKIKNTLVVIPKRYVILKQFSMPSQDEGEIQKMLALKILQQVPFTQEEIVFDHCVLEKTPDGYTKVLTAISPLEQTSALLKMLEQAGLKITNVLISSFGIAGWFSQISQEKKPVGILNLDYDDAELCFCYQGKFLFSRNFNAGLSDLNNDNAGDMLNQVDLTLKAYKNEFPSLDVEKIFIVTDYFQIDPISQGIAERFNIPVETIRPSERIACELPVLSLIKNNSMISLIGGWGFVVGQSDYQIDLIPHSTQQTEETPFVINTFLKFSLTVCVFLVLLVVALRFETYQKYVYLQELQRKTDNIQEPSKDEEQKLIDIHKMQSVISQQLPLADLIRDIYQETPNGIFFRQLQFNQDYSLIIEGVSSSQETLSSFEKRLQNLSWFKNVTLQKRSAPQYKDQGFSEFKIIGQAYSPGETKKP